MPSSKNAPTDRRRWIRAIFRFATRCVLVVFIFVGLFVASSFVLGRIPRNNGFQHAAEDGVEILIVSNGVHVDLIIPLDEPAFRMRPLFENGSYRSDSQLFTHAIVGWGNRKFYLETPSWNETKLSNVLYAFSGFGETAVHVDLTTSHWFGVKREKQRLLRLSNDQFKSLCEHIDGTIKKDAEGRSIPIDCKPYGNSDCFFEGGGKYHLFRTCNVWVGEGLRKSGVRVGVWTVTPKSLFACLPDNAPSLPRLIEPNPVPR